MELVVEAARVADWLPVGVPAPERGGVGAAVAAAGPLALRARLQHRGGVRAELELFRASVTHQAALGLHQGPVGSVHLVVEATSVAEIVTIAVPSPQRSGGRATVHTLATLCK